MKLKRCCGLLVTKVGEETLVYNQGTDQAHCLNTAAARVFTLCDGTLDFRDVCERLATDLGVDRGEALTRESVDLLIQHGLIEGDLPVEQPERRALLKKALTLAAMVPLVWSVVAPAPSEATSQPLSAPTIGTPE